MSHIDQHPPGAFCWIELATSDQNAAKQFYGSLFGWSYTDFPMGPDDLYTIFKLEGRDAAAAYTIRPDQKAQGVPPHWMVYVAVKSADETAALVGGLGGKVLAPPFDVFTLGRMAVIQDPTGATFSLWEAKSHHGIGIADVPGTFCWADLMTPDVERASKFYTELFGWKLTPGQDHSGYLHIANGEKFIGGIPPAHTAANNPPHWIAYLAVTDCDKSTADAEKLGATAYVKPTSIEKTGKFAVLADPQGAAFALFQSILAE
jgi:hypothetical protein